MGLNNKEKMTGYVGWRLVSLRNENEVADISALVGAP